MGSFLTRTTLCKEKLSICREPNGNYPSAETDSAISTTPHSRAGKHHASTNGETHQQAQARAARRATALCLRSRKPTDRLRPGSSPGLVAEERTPGVWCRDQASARSSSETSPLGRASARQAGLGDKLCGGRNASCLSGGPIAKAPSRSTSPSDAVRTFSSKVGSAQRLA